MHQHHHTKIIWTGFLWRIFFLLIVTLIGYTAYFIFNVYHNLNKITQTETQTASDTSFNNPADNDTEKKSSFFHKKLQGESDNRINILLLGLDGGERKSGTYLTDTIILASIDPHTYRASLLSIPRDLYVQIPHTDYHTKINALYTYGLKNAELDSPQAVELIRQAVEEITGQKIPYYIIVDFAGFKEVIKILDGIDITVPEDIKDTRYPGPNYSYETFEIKKGPHHLDAETALKYARVRHTKGGDFGRAERQQQIMTAVRQKALSLKLLSNPQKIIELSKVLGDHIKTNLDKYEIWRLIELTKDINPQQITTKVLDAWSKDSLLRSTHILLGGRPAYVLQPRIKTYAEIQNLAENIFHLEKIEDDKKHITEEQAKIKLLTATPSTYNTFKKILRQWNYTPINQYNHKEYQQICPPNRDAIISYSQKDKLYTLNDLALKLNTKITYQDNTSSTKEQKKSFSSKNTDRYTPSNHKTDIVLCITEQTAKFFLAADKKEDITTDKNETILNEQGQALFNKFNKLK